MPGRNGENLEFAGRLQRNVFGGIQLFQPYVDTDLLRALAQQFRITKRGEMCPRVTAGALQTKIGTDSGRFTGGYDKSRCGHAVEYVLVIE